MDQCLQGQETTRTKARINRIKYCRLFLQAVTISDIINVEGTQIDTAKLKETWWKYSSTTGNLNINQQKIEEKSWVTFRKYIRQWTNRKGKLNTPLEAWIIPTGKQRKKWPAYQGLDKQSLFLYLPELVKANCIHNIYTYTNTTTTLPE